MTRQYTMIGSPLVNGLSIGVPSGAWSHAQSIDGMKTKTERQRSSTGSRMESAGRVDRDVRPTCRIMQKGRIRDEQHCFDRMPYGPTVPMDSLRRLEILQRSEWSGWNEMNVMCGYKTNPSWRPNLKLWRRKRAPGRTTSNGRPWWKGDRRGVRNSRRDIQLGWRRRRRTTAIHEEKTGRTWA